MSQGILAQPLHVTQVQAADADTNLLQPLILHSRRDFSENQDDPETEDFGVMRIRKPTLKWILIDLRIGITDNWNGSRIPHQ